MSSADVSDRPVPEERRLSKLSVGMSHSSRLCFTHDDLKQFAKLSGDYNPLHLDEHFAAAQGFENCVVYGGLIFAQLSCVIGMHLPGRFAIWMGGRLDFRKPLLVGQHAEMTVSIGSVSEATRTIMLDVELKTDNLKLAKGFAQVMVHEGAH
jgi:3-hydroxybutyryl-CoA dehydratase